MNPKQINNNDQYPIDDNEIPENDMNDHSPNAYNSDGDDLMNKLNEEAENLDSHVDKDNLQMLTKYADLSNSELREIIREKNNVLLTLNDEKEISKKELNKIIKNLNEIIAKNADVLYHKDPDRDNMLKLQQQIKLRTKDSHNARNSNKIIKNQYELISNKANAKMTADRLNIIESQIDAMKKNNADLVKQTRELAHKSSVQSKEMEICSENKTYPKKIIAYTNEVKSLASKKHEYYTKLASNKKSLSNTLKELKKLEDIYNAFLSEETNESVAKKTGEWMSMIKADLEGSEEDIFARAEQGNSKVLYAMEKERLLNKENQIILPMINIHGTRARSLSPQTKDTANKNKNNNAHGNITSMRENDTVRPYKGIFNKFTYFKPKGKLPHYMTGSKEAKRKEEIKNNNHYHNSTNDISVILEYDYDNTTNADYRELLSKKELYVDIITKIERSFKEIEKMSDRKLKNISSTIESNGKRLKSLQQQNEFLELEIKNLSKLLVLNMEHSRIGKEIKANESKMYKMNPLQQQHTINDASITQNDILQELNYLDEEKKRTFQPTNSNVMESHGNLKHVMSDMEHVDSNKNMRFPDISNVERIDEDNALNDREKKLLEIKNKYIPIENEVEEKDAVVEDNQVKEEEEGQGDGDNEEGEEHNQEEEEGEEQNLEEGEEGNGEEGDEGNAEEGEEGEGDAEEGENNNNNEEEEN